MILAFSFLCFRLHDGGGGGGGPILELVQRRWDGSDVDHRVGVDFALRGGAV